MASPKVVFVCKECPFATEDKQRAEKHSAPLHHVWRFESSELIA